MQGREEDDEIVAYNNLFNDDPTPSHTPPHTPIALSDENEGKGEDRKDLEEGQGPEEDRRATESARREKRHKEFEALSLKLSDNGYKMRLKVWADPEQAFRPMPMTAPISTGKAN